MYGGIPIQKTRCAFLNMAKAAIARLLFSAIAVLFRFKHEIAAIGLAKEPHYVHLNTIDLCRDSAAALLPILVVLVGHDMLELEYFIIKNSNVATRSRHPVASQVDVNSC